MIIRQSTEVETLEQFMVVVLLLKMQKEWSRWTRALVWSGSDGDKWDHEMETSHVKQGMIIRVRSALRHLKLLAAE